MPRKRKRKPRAGVICPHCCEPTASKVVRNYGHGKRLRQCLKPSCLKTFRTRETTPKMDRDVSELVTSGKTFIEALRRLSIS